MACYKVGTRESLKTALTILGGKGSKNDQHFFSSPGLKSSQSISKKGSLAIAWLAHSLGEYRLAFDIVNKQEATHNATLLLVNIKLMILADSGRLREGVTYLRTAYLSGSSRRESRVVCYCAVSNLLEKVRMSQDKQLLQELMEIVNMLDEVAVVVNTEVEELVMRPTMTSKEYEQMFKGRNRRKKGRKSGKTKRVEYGEGE